MTTRSTSAASSLTYVLPCALLLAIGCSGIFDRDLWTPDEPRVAAISLEMGRTGDLVIPRLAGEPFVEEPPLYYAAAAGAVKLFGFVAGNTGAIRLTSVLWGLGALAASYRLARRFHPARQALATVLMLATMLGFIENTHWIRVDAALLCLVTSSVWCCAEMLIGGRGRFAVPAGVFAAGAFLVKGVVGPGMIALGWLALFVARAWKLSHEAIEPATGQSETEGAGRRSCVRGAAFSGIRPLVYPHLLCAAAFVGIVGAWILLFRSWASPELWDEWFWKNQVGRALGTAPQLGHLKPGRPFYYLRTIAVYTLPWTPLLGIWLWRLVRDLRGRRMVAPVNLFLAAWSVATVVVLSVSATKRDLYLLPMLPAFALMCAGVLDTPVPRWCRMFLAGWGIVCTALLATCAYAPLTAYSPFLMHKLSATVSPEAVLFITSLSPSHVLAGVCMVICLMLLLCAPVPGLVRTAAITAAAFVGLSAVAGKAVDIEKRIGPGLEAFVGRLPESHRDNIGGWGFSETMRGSFYYYGDWQVKRVDELRRLHDILAGKDRQFDSVIVSTEFGPPDLVGIPVEELAETAIGPRGHERKLIWMRAAKPAD